MCCRTNNAMALLAAMQGKYPAYYVTGNHEYWSRQSEEMLEILREYGVTVLAGAWESTTIREQTLHICGADDPDVDLYMPARPGFRQQLQALQSVCENGNYTILLSHRPERFAEYSAFDLVLSGHAHGGQWRVPGLWNGIFSPGEGFFPQYAGGVYQAGSTTMIVSRGLSRESIPLPRLFNRPELVVIDLGAAP